MVDVVLIYISPFDIIFFTRNSLYTVKRLCFTWFSCSLQHNFYRCVCSEIHIQGEQKRRPFHCSHLKIKLVMSLQCIASSWSRLVWNQSEANPLESFTTSQTSFTFLEKNKKLKVFQIKSRTPYPYKIFRVLLWKVEMWNFECFCSTGRSFFFF